MNARMMSAYMYCIYRFTMEVHVQENYVMFDRDIVQCMQRKWEAGMLWFGVLMLFMYIHSQGS